jgi:DNA-binding transcriptional regulator YiaG
MSNEIEVTTAIDGETINEMVSTEEKKEKSAGEIVGTIAEEAGKKALKMQAESIDRLISQSKLKADEIAQRLSVSRQLVYLWRWGKQIISEHDLERLANLFDRDPIEVRYGITLFKQKDLYYVVRSIESELQDRGVLLAPDKKAYVVASIFTEFQNLKRVFGEQEAIKNFDKSLHNSIEILAMA